MFNNIFFLTIYPTGADRTGLLVISMSKKVFYIYNPKTLTYERVYPSLRQRIAVVLRHLLVGGVISIALVAGLYFGWARPKRRFSSSKTSR